MEFRLDDGQVELQQTVARFCASTFPLDTIAEREEIAVDRTAWAALGDLGVFALLLDEADGGAGLGVVDAAIVFEQLGSSLAPGPLLWTLLAAPYLPGVADGRVVVTGADRAAVHDGSLVVEHAGDADALLIVGDDGIEIHRTASMTAVALQSLDPLNCVGRYDGIGTGDVLGDAAAATHARSLGTVLSAAMLVGVAERSLHVARDYALERHQFGAPIGSFQAIKHLLADMYARHVVAQSAVYAAAAVLDDPGNDDQVAAAAGAQLLASHSALENSSTAIQVLGGMGFTWDMLPNYLLKRAWAMTHSRGDGEDLELYLAAALAESAA